MQAMASAELDDIRAETRGRIAAVHAELLSARRLAALYHTTVLPQVEAASTSALASYRSGGVDFMAEDDQGYLHKYSISESIEDGTTLPLYYNLAPNEMLVPRKLMEDEFLQDVLERSLNICAITS